MEAITTTLTILGIILYSGKNVNFSYCVNITKYSLFQQTKLPDVSQLFTHNFEIILKCW